MQGSVTTASSRSRSLNGSTRILDSTPVTCTETETFSEVLEEEEWESFYYSFKTEQLVTLWVLFVITVVGNALVLFSTWRRKRKSRMTFFVTQLAVTDCFTGLINILTDIIWRITGDFMAPDLVCRIVRYLQVVLLYASTYVLVSLSIDRYHAIVHPMKFLQGERQAKFLIVISWGLSFLFSIPTLIIFGKRELSNGEVQCWAAWPDESYWIPYMTTVAFLVYFIPLIIISYQNLSASMAGTMPTWYGHCCLRDLEGCCPNVIFTDSAYNHHKAPLIKSGLIPHSTGALIQRFKFLDLSCLCYSLLICSVIYFIVIRTIWAKSKANAVVVSNCSDGKFSASFNRRGLICKAKIKAVKYSVTVILAFVLCWSPYFLFDILDNFSVLPETKERFYAAVIIQNLPALNSAMNPIIYCIFSDALCRTFRQRNRSENLGTFKEKTEGQEMQVLSKPESI